MSKLSMRDVDLQGKRVFMRVDFNVPIKGCKVKDATRIEASIPSIRLALEKGARLVLASHLGRPKGERNPEMSLAPVAADLSARLGMKVGFVNDCIGDEVNRAANALRPGEVLLLENLRYYNEEEKNDPAFARKLAGLADVYINDAFGTAHRAHASTEGMTRYIPTRAAGLLMEKEITYLGNALGSPDRPFLAILGGAKVSDKIEVIRNLIPKVDALLIGGGMAYTFLEAQGQHTGNSLVEKDKIDLARELLQLTAQRHVPLELPRDHIAGERAAEDAAVRMVPPGQEIPDGWMGLDIGPQTRADYVAKIKPARTVIWNGPLGMFEMKPFAQGTMTIAQALAASSAITIVGGGDTVAAVHQAGVAERFTHISTGGGASLEFLEGKVLPGVAALSDK